MTPVPTDRAAAARQTLRDMDRTKAGAASRSRPSSSRSKRPSRNGPSSSVSSGRSLPGSSVSSRSRERAKHVRVKAEAVGTSRSAPSVKKGKSEVGVGEQSQESENCQRGLEMIFAGLDICLGDPTLQDSSLLAMGAKVHFPLKARGLSLRQYMIERGMVAGGESK